MSRWLQTKVASPNADLKVFDVMMTSYGVQRSTADCNSWTQSNSLTHPTLRDKSGGIASIYGLVLSDMFVVDRNLKIVYKSQVTDTLSEDQVLKVVNQLK